MSKITRNGASGGNGTGKLTVAKLRANRTDHLLKVLCFRWMKQHMPRIVDRLRRRARGMAA